MYLIEVKGIERWTVHNRLQELGIVSSCRIGEPLYATVNSPQEAIGIWSVAQLSRSSRKKLVSWLNLCLEKPLTEVV